jgi:hypothetical protein
MHIRLAIFIASSAISRGESCGVIGQGLRRGLRKRAAGADRGNAGVGLDHVSLPAQQERRLFVGNQQQGFEMAQKFVGAPVFCEFDGARPRLP